MEKNLIFGLILARFGPNLVPNFFFLWVLSLIGVIHFCKLSLYAIQEKIINKTWENAKKFFSKIWLPVTRYHGQLSSCTISGKIMIKSWENVVRATRTDGQTDRNDFIGRCSTKVERPKVYYTCARFHHCGICVTDFRSILNMVKNGRKRTLNLNYVENYSKCGKPFDRKSFCLLLSWTWQSSTSMISRNSLSHCMHFF